ncbi:MAG: sporulation protein [Flavobacteriales bacterium]|nr:sporulation protein [Flavobacteriales bacterium]
MAKTLTSFLKDEANTQTIIGKEFKLGEFTCVPVMRVGMGLGYGSGEGQAEKQKGSGEGTGGAAGIGADPLGFLVTRGSDISFVPTHAAKGLGKAFERMPDVLERFLNKDDAKKATKEN